MSEPTALPPEEDALLVVSDEPVDLSRTPLEGWVALGLFWALGATVAWQFFTRYVLESSAGWTEEIARYLLVATVFVGAALGVIHDEQLQMDFLLRRMPRRLGRLLSLGVDLLRVALFACLGWLTAQLMARIGGDEMTVVALPMNTLYAVIELALCALTWRAFRVAWARWRRPPGAAPDPSREPCSPSHS